MTVIVQKYGGSSLATLEHIQKVAKSIVETRTRGYQLAVVVRPWPEKLTGCWNWLNSFPSPAVGS